jgi:type II secretory pathway component PulM
MDVGKTDAGETDAGVEEIRVAAERKRIAQHYALQETQARERQVLLRTGALECLCLCQYIFMCWFVCLRTMPLPTVH